MLPNYENASTLTRVKLVRQMAFNKARMVDIGDALWISTDFRRFVLDKDNANRSAEEIAADIDSMQYLKTGYTSHKR